MPINTTVQMPGQREASTLKNVTGAIGAIGSGLNVAKQLFGLDVDTQKLKLLEREQQLKEQAMQGDNDPTSPLSQAVREQAKRQGIQIPDTVASGQIKKDSPLYEMINTASKGAEDRKTQLAKADVMSKKGFREETDPMTGLARMVPASKQLPSDKVLNVDDGNAIPQLLGDVKTTLEANKDIMGPVRGRVGGLNPYDTRSQAFDAQMRSVSQMFGRYMEGGVLRKEDEEKYRHMFPKLADTPDVAQAKLQNVDRVLAMKQTSNIAALKESGYDVSGVDKKLKVPGLPDVITRGKAEDGVAHAGDNSQRVINGRVYVKVKGGWKGL